MAQELKVGDVVKLKSGGPRMTVEAVGKDSKGEPMVWCTWFDVAQKHKDHFAPDALEK